MVVPLHMAKPIIFDATMPEISEEDTQAEAYSEGKDSLKPVPHTLPSYYGTFASQTHHHHESTSTSNSDSAGSSPTTTVSTVDDSSVTELSPGSSPESPMAKTPLPAVSIGQIQPQNPSVQRPHSQPAQLFDMQQRPSTPGKRPKNLKNLAVNTTGSTGVPRGASTGALPTSTTINTLLPKEQSDRLFARPPSPPKRRPNNLSLTIMTPGHNKPLLQTLPDAIPPTPSFSRPSLRHFQSSPSLPAFSKDLLNSAPPLPSIARPMIERALSDQGVRPDEDEQNFDIPQSREEKPEAYPDGPICVYDPHLDLYLEPTATQASAYDVVLNVASEVHNPFLPKPSSSSSSSSSTSNIRLDGGGGIQYAPKRERNSSQSSSTTVLKAVREVSSPTTPKASPRSEVFPLPLYNVAPDPEYIHIPWEHNTDIVPDLLRLVKLIDDRVRQGKRILVHCQCGVSRSATLVVAYCMYKHPEMSVQEAYDTIKRRSKWIGPNMNLIMQLQEFRSSLAGGPRRNPGLRSLTPIEASRSWNEWGRSASTQGARLDPNVPKTAPLPPTERSDDPMPTLGEALSPGPSSAPSGLSWPVDASADAEKLAAEKERNARAQSVPDQIASPVDSMAIRSAPVSPKQRKRPHSLRFENAPMRDVTVEVTAPEFSPRSEQFAMTALQPSAAVASEDRFGLLSPSANAFHHNPLDRDSLLTSLGMGTTYQAEPQRKRHQNFSLPYRKSLSAERPDPSESGSSHVPPVTQPMSNQGDTEMTGFDALLSPRAAEFTENPFAPPDQKTHTPPFEVKSTEKDPRSPPQKGAAPITRNIADIL